MDAAFTGVWPAGVPGSLWNYELLKPGVQRLLPLMGFRVDWSYLLWFLFGVAVIAFFARQRFKQRTFDPSSFDYRVLTKLAPTQLRGPGPMRRAYAYYAAILIAIYTAMTFFGGLIVRTVGAIPMAGLQVEVDTSFLHSVQWPLTLALALAGFAPLIKPLEVVETWLRQKAHQWVGIPVKIKEHTRTLLKNLEGTIKVDVAAETKKLPEWVADHLGDADSLGRVFMVREELRLLVRLARDDGSWPQGSVRDELEQLEAEEVAEAEAALQDFTDLLAAAYDPPQAPGAPAPKLAEVQKRHRQLEGKLLDAIQRIERLRDELGSTFAVYAERDDNFDRIRDARFAKVMRESFPEDATPPGPDFAILLMLLPVFLLYSLACALGVHPLLIDSVDRVAVTVFATAALETARIAALFWLPVLAVFFLRSYLKAVETRPGDDWVPVRLRRLSGAMVRRMLMVAGLAALVSLAGLALLSLLWVAVISKNQTRFHEVLLSGPAPVLPFFLSQAGAGALLALVVVAAADDDAAPRERFLAPWGYGLLAAALVLCWMAGTMLYWYGGAACTGPGGIFLLDVLTATPGCYGYYGTTDLVVYGVIAFLAAAVFARPARNFAKRRRRRLADAGGAEALAGGAAVVVLTLTLTLTLAGAGAALAQDTGAGTAADTAAGTAAGGRKVVVAGFRKDAEPFSFSIMPDNEQRFVGYIADLCYKIFAGSHYTVISAAVDARDRFDRLRMAGDPPYDPARPEAEQKIDILCDPVTLRFSEPEPRSRGIFSPIVFASGVSYILRPTRAPRSDAYLAYVDNSTASAVAERACEIDLLGVRGKGASQDCAAPITAAEAEACPTGETPAAASGEPAYRFCVMESHTDIIAWFCQESGTALPYQLAYFGDREIILGKLAAWRAQGHDCPAEGIEQEQGYYTYEPYALLISKADVDLVQHVQRRIYEFFSHRSEAVSLFTTYFPGVQISPTVAWLFLLNAVTEEKFFKRGTPEALPLPPPLGQAVAAEPGLSGSPPALP